MKTNEELERLHEEFKTFNSIKLCEILLGAVLHKSDERLIKIIKTYLYRRLQKEGIIE